MSEPGTFFIDDELEPQNSGTSLIDTVETPEETFFRTLAEESWQKYQFLRRRATRQTPRSHFFELQSHGRGFRPAVMSGNQPSVPLPMGNMASGSSGNSGAPGAAAQGGQSSELNSTSQISGHTAREGNTLGEAAGGPQGAVGGVPSRPPGASNSANRTVRSSANIFNDPERQEQILRVINEGPRNINQSLDGDQANRSIRESIQRAGQAVGDAFRQCANASPFRQPGTSGQSAQQQALAQLVAGSRDPGSAIQLNTGAQANTRPSVHFSSAQINIEPSDSSSASRNSQEGAVAMARGDPRGAIPRTGVQPPLQQPSRSSSQPPSQDTHGNTAGQASGPPPQTRDGPEHSGTAQLPQEGQEGAQTAHVLPISRNSSEGTVRGPMHSTPHTSFDNQPLQRQALSSIPPPPVSRSMATFSGNPDQPLSLVNDNLPVNAGTTPSNTREAGGVPRSQRNSNAAVPVVINQDSVGAPRHPLLDQATEALLQIPPPLSDPGPRDQIPVLPAANVPRSAPVVQFAQATESGRANNFPQATAGQIETRRSAPLMGVGQVNRQRVQDVQFEEAPRGAGAVNSNRVRPPPHPVAAQGRIQQTRPRNDTLPDPTFFEEMDADRQLLLGLTDEILSSGIETSLRLRTILGIVRQVNPEPCLIEAFETVRDTIYQTLWSSQWWLNEQQPLRNEINAIEEMWTPILMESTMRRLQIQNTQQQERRNRYVPSGVENDYVHPPPRPRSEAPRQALGRIDPNVPLGSQSQFQPVANPNGQLGAPNPSRITQRAR